MLEGKFREANAVHVEQENNEAREHLEFLHMNKIIVQYQDVLLRFFTQRVRNVWDAEELTQEVFCKILKRTGVSLDTYTEPYIFTIAWSVLRDRSRRDRVRLRDMHVAYDETYSSEDPVTPEQSLNGDELYQHFLRALNQLSPRVRQVFLLNRYEGLSYQEIAERCQITLSAVEKHMIKALQRIKEIER